MAGPKMIGAASRVGRKINRDGAKNVYEPGHMGYSSRHAQNGGDKVWRKASLAASRRDFERMGPRVQAASAVGGGFVSGLGLGALDRKLGPKQTTELKRQIAAQKKRGVSKGFFGKPTTSSADPFMRIARRSRKNVYSVTSMPTRKQKMVRRFDETVERYPLSTVTAVTAAGSGASAGGIMLAQGKEGRANAKQNRGLNRELKTERKAAVRRVAAQQAARR